jgi:hypothetical protein
LNRLDAKCVLLILIGKAKACGVDQLCVGLEAGIKGGIDVMHLLWETHKAEEEWGFLLIDANNGFNEQGNRTAMCWTICHKWPSGARFTFNCYRHCSVLLSTGLHSFSTAKRESHKATINGCLWHSAPPDHPFSQDKIPDVDQPWYADDAGAGGSFTRIWQYFEKLQELGPRQAHFPEPLKSILIVQAHNKAAAEISFKVLGFTIITAAHCLGGFLGDAANQLSWVQEKMENWVAAIKELALVMERYPQAAYAGLQKFLQQAGMVVPAMCHRWTQLGVQSYQAGAASGFLTCPLGR